LDIRLLGPVEVRANHLAVGYGRPQQGVALAVLAEHAGRPVPVEALVRCVWGDRPPSGAVRLLNTHITRIRRMFEQACAAAGDAVIEVSRRAGGYVLQVEPERVDLHRFRRLVTRAEAPDGPAGDRVTLLRQALALWRGEALTGLPGSWVEQTRHAWNQQRLAAVLAWATAELQAGRPSFVIDALVPEVARHQLVEPLVATLMRALAATGRGAEALEYYTNLRGRLVEELGTDPGAQVQAVHQSILRGEFDVPEAPIAASSPLRLGATPRVAPAQLPADVPAFTGRTGELARLDALCDEAATARPATAVVISAVCGTAGVGKTALALHWAHRVRDRYPDGQLYVNLRGYDPDQPMSAADALAVLLDALGVAAQDVPLDTDARAARYRTELAGRRILVVLDNAATVEQVRPLLPGTASCATVVTSRDSLAGLVALHGAQRIELDLLPAAEARALLRRLIGERADSQREATNALAERCERLPLALRVAAELAVARPHMPLGELADELADLQRRLDLLDAGGDPRAAVASVFSWSVHHLPPAAARAFRLLGLHPGPDFDGYAVAAMANTGLADAERTLCVLARAHLLHVTTTGRFGMHDLLRAFAASLSEKEDSAADRQAAVGRLYDYYVAVAACADERLYHGDARRRPRSIPVPTTPVPDLADPDVARAWLDAERRIMVAVAAHAARHGWPRHSVGLSTVLFRYLDSGYNVEALALHQSAREAAALCGDLLGQAEALIGLGIVRLRFGQYALGARHLDEALALFGRAGAALGQARALANLGIAEQLQGRYRRASSYQERALGLYRRIGDRLGEARSINDLGILHQRLGRYDRAAEYHTQALALLRSLGDQTGEVIALNDLGDVELRLGRYEEAQSYLRQSLTLSRQIGDRTGEAWSRTIIGDAYARAGRGDEAAHHYREAVAIFEDIGDRDGRPRALNGLGESALTAGHLAEAHTHHAAALAIATDLDARDQQARAHTGLGHAHRAAGDTGGADRHYRRALEIYVDLRSPEAEAIQAHLASLASLASPPRAEDD
jgi:DNA-binding SARP family transcriptional activator/Tfp pilus assembly protein PilF